MPGRSSKTPISETHPQILEYWDYEANGGVDPTKVVAGTARRANWICPIGHKFDSEIRKQAEGIRCPVCSGKRVLAGFNDLATTHAELAKEWDHEQNTLKPHEITAGSSLKAFWLCREGHSFQTQVAIRKRGIGCGYCANSRVLPGFNDIETKFPELAKEWDYSLNDGLSPSEVLSGGKRKRDWVCAKGHRFKQSMESRRSGSGCLVCAGKAVQQGANDLASQFPEIAAEWDFEKNMPLQPTEVTHGSGRKVFWRCPEGHSYQASIANRKRTGCPICVGQIVVAGVNDLASARPELVADWDFEANAPLTPQEVSAMSGRKVSWKCGYGHQWRASINVRKGCPYCAGVRVIVGKTDLAAKFPTLAAEWDHEANGGLGPSTIAVKSHVKVGWICSEGHRYRAVVSSRTSGTGCPYCSGRKILAGFNDLASRRPDIAAEWDNRKNFPLRPDEVSVFSGQSAHWLCAQGHRYELLIAYRTQAGCPTCGGRKLIRGHNDLATLNPELSSEWDILKNGGVSPADVTAYSGKKYFWLCAEGHSYSSAVYARQNGNGCPRCATSGYNPASPGLFYLISNEKLRAKKVGITNPHRKTHRLLEYGGDWEVIETLYSRDGEAIQTIETRTLSWLRKEKNLYPYLAREDMGRNGGQSETFEAAAVSDEELLEVVYQFVSQMGLTPTPFDWIRRQEI